MDNFDIQEAPKEEKIHMEIQDEKVQFEEEEAMPVIKEKEYIVPDDVFKKAEEFEKIVEPLPVPVIKKTKRTRKMTPEALEKLAKAREKANETRRRNKELRMKGKLKTPTQIKEDKKKEIIEQKRPVVNNIVHETKNITNNITEEDIARISTEATRKTLLEYELIRKERKEAKKKKKEEEQYKLAITNKINTALGRPAQTNFVSHYF
tara:strand:+ start:70 stop:690 length:621 start_codon:yes stop_codon:yes gene_type:complete